jgi:hypothetical protein
MRRVVSAVPIRPVPPVTRIVDMDGKVIKMG